jgi:hypothetical protein
MDSSSDLFEYPNKQSNHWRNSSKNERQEGQLPGRFQFDEHALKRLVDKEVAAV